MNCEHGGETGLNEACEECLNEALAKEFEAGRKSGRSLAFQAFVALLAEKAGELFVSRREDEARLVRGVHDAVVKMMKEER